MGELNTETKDKGTEQSVPNFSEKIGNMTYNVSVHFNEQSKQNVQDKLRRVIIHKVDGE